MFGFKFFKKYVRSYFLKCKYLTVNTKHVFSFYINLKLHLDRPKSVQCGTY